MNCYAISVLEKNSDKISVPNTQKTKMSEDSNTTYDYDNDNSLDVLKEEVVQFLHNLYNEGIIKMDEYVDHLKDVNDAIKNGTSIISVSNPTIIYFILLR